MKAAAANSDVLCFKKNASRREISARYWEKKKIWSSEDKFDSFLYLYRNLNRDGAKKLNSRVLRISSSSFKTSSLVNLFSDTFSRSFKSGG